MYEDIIKFVGGATILTAAVAWLIRSLTSHLLSKDIEIFKNQLALKSEYELEKLRHDLKLMSSEHEKKMQILHERRAEIIAELYSRLLEFIRAAENYTADPDKFDATSKETRASIFAENAGKFKNYFEKNRIYFNKRICDQMDSLSKDVIGNLVVLQIRFASSESGGLKGFDRYQETWDKAIILVHEKVPTLKAEIENVFRELIGVT